MEKAWEGGGEMGSSSRDDVDRLFACFKCGTSTPGMRAPFEPRLLDGQKDLVFVMVCASC